MTDMPISQELAERLNTIAEQSGRSLDQVIEDMLAQYDAPASAHPVQKESWALKMARMAAEDTDIEWNEFAAQGSERSRELLHRHYAEEALE